MPKQRRKIAAILAALSMQAGLSFDFDSYLEEAKKEIIEREMDGSPIQPTGTKNRSEQKDGAEKEEVLKIIGSNRTIISEDNPLERFEISSGKYINIIQGEFSSLPFFKDMLKKLEKEHEFDKRTKQLLDKSPLPQFLGQTEISINNLGDLKKIVIKNEDGGNILVVDRETGDLEYTEATEIQIEFLSDTPFWGFVSRFKEILGTQGYSVEEHVSFVSGKEKSITRTTSIGTKFSISDNTIYKKESTYQNRVFEKREVSIRWNLKTIFFEDKPSFEGEYSIIDDFIKRNKQGQIILKVGNEYTLADNLLLIAKELKGSGLKRSDVEKINDLLNPKGIKILF